MDLFCRNHKVAIIGTAALAAGVVFLSVRGCSADEGEPYANAWRNIARQVPARRNYSFLAALLKPQRRNE